MKILLSMPRDGQSDVYILDSLMDLGHEVYFCDHRSNINGCVELCSKLLNYVDMFLVLYLVPGQTYPKELLDNWKSQFPHVKYVSWFFDVTMMDPNQKKIVYGYEYGPFLDIIKTYDFFFTVARGDVEKYKKAGVNAFWCPEGAHKYALDLTDIVDKTYDVSFVGQIGNPYVHQERLPLLKSIGSQFSLVVYGPLFVNDEEIRKYHKLRPTLTEVEHAKITAFSRICLSHSGWPEIDGYFSARTYRLMSQGGCVLANRTKNVEQFFEEDKEIVLYSSEKECIDKIQWLLDNPEKRDEIAKAGKERVFDSYLFDHSLSRLLSHLLGKKGKQES